jgi:transmembrane sensor
LLSITADAHTGTGTRRTIALDDGSTLILNARSAVNIHMRGNQRVIRLLDGDIIARVAADPTRPFIVETRDGSVRALGTQFVVSQRKHDSLVAVLEHSVMVNNTATSQMVLEEGAAARFDQHGVTRLEKSQADSLASWTDGVLDVRNQSLGEVINALRPYQSGYMHISPQAAALRVFGIFPLDDPAAALISLVETQPIVLRQLGPLLTWIDLQK